MNFGFLLDLLKNVSIFFTLIYLIKCIVLSKSKFPPKLEYAIEGALIAIIVGIGMMMRIELGEGNYIDGRIILVGISAAYVHPIAGIVSAFLVSLFRLFMGGMGVPIGILGICGGALVGILFYKRNKSIPKKYSPQMLILLGLLLTIQAQIWIPILFPWDVAVKLLQKVSLVGLISYPIGTLIIGFILDTLRRQKQAEEKTRTNLKEKEILLQEVRQNKIWFEDFVTFLPGAVVEMDENLMVTYVNQAGFDLFGYTDQDIQKGMLGRDLLHPDDQENVIQHIVGYHEEKRASPTEYRIMTKSGEEVPVLFKSMPILSDAKISGFRAVFTDIKRLKKAEKALWESQQQLQSLIHNIQVAIVVHNSKTEIVTSNAVAYDLLGLTKEQMRGKAAIDPDWHFLNDDGSILAVEDFPVNKVLNSKHPLLDYIIGIKKPDEDNLVWVLVNAKPLFNNREEVYQVIVTFIDITERRQARQTVRENLRYLEIAQKMAKLGHWKLDAQTHEVVGSDELFNIFELDKDKLTLNSFANVVHPDDLEYDMEHIKNGIEKGEPWDIEHRLLLEDGTMKTIRAIGEPLVNESGIITELIGTVQDITESKKTAEALRVSEKRFKDFFNLTADLVCIADINGYFRLLNPVWEKILGYSISELTAKPFLEFIHPEDRDTTLKMIKERLEKGNTVLNFENRYICKDGKVIYLEWTSQPSVSEGMTFAIARDITQRKQVGEQIKANLKEKEILLQEIHHRVKNNLTVISSLLDLQARRARDDRAIAVLQDSKNRVEAMSMIHENLYHSDNLSSIDMEHYFSKLVTTIIQSYGNIQNRVTHNIVANNIRIDLKTVTPLGLVVNELVTNALKYAFPENNTGEILIQLNSDKENSYELIVADDGIGFPKEYDWHDSDSLGFTLITMIVENQLDGTIDIDGEQGTAFSIKFITDQA